MKKTPESPRKKVQRESVRRIQQSGKRQAAAATRRITRESHDNTRRTLPEPDDVSLDVPWSLRRAFVLLLVLMTVGIIGYVLVSNLSGFQHIQVSGPNPDTTATPVQQAQVISDITRIGIVSGHRGNDSGSVCSDGLTEAQVNYDVAVRVASLLRADGYTVDILNEFDTRLKGYQARLLLSIHADSCTYINELATGYKVARVLESKTPDEDDHLVACISARYKSATGLKFHANTVTHDMTQYHAFYEIDPQTPAAIIETGFLNLDRSLLTDHPDMVAQGIYNGIKCFLNGEEP
jgi:N-acetylmuramoyl-L-alanine amidase